RIRRSPGSSGFPPPSQFAIARSEKPVRRENTFRVSPSFLRTSSTVVTPLDPKADCLRNIFMDRRLATLAFFAVLVDIGIPPGALSATSRRKASITTCNTACRFTLDLWRQKASIDHAKPASRRVKICGKQDEVATTLIGRGRDQKALDFEFKGDSTDRLSQ